MNRKEWNAEFEQYMIKRDDANGGPPTPRPLFGQILIQPSFHPTASPREESLPLHRSHFNGYPVSETAGDPLSKPDLGEAWENLLDLRANFDVDIACDNLTCSDDLTLDCETALGVAEAHTLSPRYMSPLAGVIATSTSMHQESCSDTSETEGRTISPVIEESRSPSPVIIYVEDLTTQDIYQMTDQEAISSLRAPTAPQIVEASQSASD